MKTNMYTQISYRKNWLLQVLTRCTEDSFIILCTEYFNKSYIDTDITKLNDLAGLFDIYQHFANLGDYKYKNILFYFLITYRALYR